MRDSKQDILNFWFVESSPDQWFTYDPTYDDEIAERFTLTYTMACEGLGDAWSQSADGALALCLLFDQIPRHIFHGTPRMFATDTEALAVAKYAIKRGFDQGLPHEQRFFLYLPFEHSEKPADQKRSLELFEGIADHNPRAAHVARQRYDTFARFGRFPERNAILRRPSTKEELAYLKTITSPSKL
ncbi:MAG TPA: DUF924 domain-containing protein [Rhodospirillaceae bacterium]|nr:DUF924 domain-containing protein [Rhodospirillaceae bacterium]